MTIRNLGRKALVAASATVLVAGGSAMFTGTAFASSDDGCGCHGGSSHSHHDGHHHGGGDHDGDRDVHGVRGDGGNAGNGGQSNSNCLVPVGISAGVVGQGSSNEQCNANGGQGGHGGSGVSY